MGFYMLAAYLSSQCGARLGKPHEAVSKLINSGWELRREINCRENQKHRKSQHENKKHNSAKNAA